MSSVPAGRSTELSPLSTTSGHLGKGLGLCRGHSPASPACSPDRILAAAPSHIQSMSKWRRGSCRRQWGPQLQPPPWLRPLPLGLVPTLLFWLGLREQRSGIYSWGWMSIFCASASPHPAAAGIVDAFLQVPWKTSLKLDKVWWGVCRLPL